MFEGFVQQDIALPDATLRVRHGGQGPAAVLLHGHPRTHATWQHVAPLLARHFTVVCPDLRGYGASSKPGDEPDHRQMSGRALAGDIRALMRQLGHDTFAVVGHDRGSYVAFRLAMDHPGAVTHLAFLGLVPILDALERADERFARLWWHWFFFRQPGKPERAILADPDAWYGLDSELRARLGEAAYGELRAALHDPATVHAMLEDYRAGFTVGRRHDEEDRRAGRRLRCPTLVVTATRDDPEPLYDDLPGIWRGWADDLTVRSLDCGHHLAEEAPDELTALLLDFLRPTEAPPSP